MTDNNGAEIRLGDAVEIRGAYFKRDLGFWFHTGNGSFRRVGKRGKVGEDITNWPLHSYCSDNRKNAAAKKHNSEHAEIEVVHSVPMFGVRDWFAAEADRYADRAEKARWESDKETLTRYATESRAVADRLTAELDGTEEPKKKEPEKGVRFYWNGIRVDGGKLIPCYFYIDKETVSIRSKEHGGKLPREYFVVKNDTDSYQDYFDKDSAKLTPDHPLYKYALYAAAKQQLKDEKRNLAHYEKFVRENPGYPFLSSYKEGADRAREWIAHYEKLTETDPGQPTQADYDAVQAMRTAAESARLEAEKERQQKEREKVLDQIARGREAIEKAMMLLPIQNGQPTVEIPFSEHPAFYSFTENGKSLIMSIPAAEVVLQHYDKEAAAKKSGYDKTDFIIRYTNPETGEQDTYEGRYDLGCEGVGLIEHIRQYGENIIAMSGPDAKISLPDYCTPERGAAIVRLADMLEGKRPETKQPNVITVDFKLRKVI